jgi:hypothetical protein
MYFNLLTFSFKLTLSYEVHIVTYDEKWYGSANYVLNVICAEENRTEKYGYGQFEYGVGYRTPP